MAKQRNPLQRNLDRLAILPRTLRPWAMTRMFGLAIPFVRTARLEIEVLDEERCHIRLRARRRVRNHIGGVHAAALALLAETASGLVFGMNLAPDQLPLLKRMQIGYVSRAQGGLTAQAALAPDAGARIRGEPRGELVVPVTISDAGGGEPARCTMIWAWVSRRGEDQPGR